MYFLKLHLNDRTNVFTFIHLAGMQATNNQRGYKGYVGGISTFLLTLLMYGKQAQVCLSFLNDFFVDGENSILRKVKFNSESCISAIFCLPLNNSTHT